MRIAVVFAIALTTAALETGDQYLKRRRGKMDQLVISR
jgi:hypothetical protein